jgi:hypothetical protein
MCMAGGNDSFCCGRCLRAGSIVFLWRIGGAGGVVRALAAGHALTFIVLEAFATPATVVGSVITAIGTTSCARGYRGAAFAASQHSHSGISFQKSVVLVVFVGRAGRGGAAFVAAGALAFLKVKPATVVAAIVACIIPAGRATPCARGNGSTAFAAFQNSHSGISFRESVVLVVFVVRAGGRGGTLGAIRAFAFLNVEADTAGAMIVACIVPTTRAASRTGGNVRTAFSATYNGHNSISFSKIVFSFARCFCLLLAPCA